MWDEVFYTLIEEEICLLSSQQTQAQLKGGVKIDNQN